MAINIGSNFNYNGKLPNFERDSFETLLDMRSYNEQSIDEGHISYCKETDKHYKFNSNNELDSETGRWREFNSGTSSTGVESGKVKLDSDSEADYLSSFIDDSTIQIENDKFVVKNIDGLTATVDEINEITTIKEDLSNHKEDINNPHNTMMSNLADNEFNSLTNGDILSYDSEKEKWVNKVINDSDEKVKLTVDSTEASYINELIDNSSIQIKDNKLIVKSIDGMIVTIDEINNLSGLNQNIMTFIGNMTNGGIKVYSTIFASYADLCLFDFSVLEENTSYLIYVSTDENHNNNGTVYMCSSETVVDTNPPAYAGLSSATHRDISIDKVDLSSEVKGKLKVENIDTNDVALKTDLSSYLDKETFESENSGYVKNADSAKTLEGLEFTIEELNNIIENYHSHDNKEVLNNIINTGDGNKFLSDDGTYKDIAFGEPEYVQVGLNEPITNSYGSGFATLNIKGMKYGSFYGIDVADKSVNIYQSPENRTNYSDVPSILYTTNGKLQLFNGEDILIYESDIDLCGNDNVVDEIIGTTLIKRWSDTMIFDQSWEWSIPFESDGTYDYFSVKFNDNQLGKPAKQFKSSEVANIVTNGYSTVAYDDIKNVTYPAISMHYENEYHIVTFKIPTGYITKSEYSSILENFYYFTSSVNSNTKIYFRYELVNSIIEDLYLKPLTVDNDSYFVFNPTYSINAYDINWGTYIIETIPSEFICSVYGNASAKLEGKNEEELLQNIISKLLDGGDTSMNTTILKPADGSDITSYLQNEISSFTQSGGTVYIPQGSYTISSTIEIPKDVTLTTLGEVILNTNMTSSPMFFLKCGATLKNVTIKTPINYESSAILIGEVDVNYTDYATKVTDVKIIGTTPLDENNNSTAFYGNGVEIYCMNNTKELTMMYNVELTGIKVYNYDNGIYINATEPSFIATAMLINIYTDNCNIGILDHGYTTSCIGYTIQTRVNNTYGVKTKSGNFIGGRVYDLDLYNDNNPGRPNIGHPKVGYFLEGSQYGYITDPIFTEYQSKYGYDWDGTRPEPRIANIRNTWKTFKHVNEKVYSLNKNGEQITASDEFDFNGLIDNSIAFADKKYTITTNITSDDIVAGALSNIFNPFGSKTHANATLTLKNRDASDPYYIIIDFGTSKNVSAIGMDFMCVPKYTKMEAHLSSYNIEENRDDGNDYIQDAESGDYFLIVQELTDNRISVVQSTWAGSGHSAASKLKFSFANVAESSGENIIIANIYAYNLYEMSDVYLPSVGGHIYGGSITIDEDYEITDDNELVSKKYVDNLSIEGVVEKFDREDETLVTIGGLAAGSSIDGKTTKEVLEAILFPYQKPTLSFSISPSTTMYETGDIISQITFTINVTKKSNDITLINIYDNSTLLTTITDNVTNGGTFTYTYDCTITSDTTLKVEVSDGDNIVSQTKSITFNNKSYYGYVSNGTTIDETIIKGLQNSGVLGTNKLTYNNIEFEDSKLVYAYPQEYGTLSSITDSNGFNYIDSYSCETMVIDNIDYYIYIMNDSTTVDGFKQIFA